MGNAFAAPSLKLTVTGPGTGDNFGQLVYEPSWNQPGGGSQLVPADDWQTVSILPGTGGGDDASGGWWWTGGYEIPSGGGGPPIRSLSEWAAALAAADAMDFPSARVVAVSVGVGTYNPGQIGYFDEVCIENTPFDACYDFEDLPPPTAFCFGDGSGTACPCMNTGSAGNGCPNSTNPAGANLAASGSACLSTDTLVLMGSGMPLKSCFYYQGARMQNGGAGLAFGDGLRCAGGVPVLIGYKFNSAGASSYPGPFDPLISTVGGVMGPGTRTYQITYQDTAAFCTPAQFNHTNGVSVTWGP
jgi:hypothetical protein